MQPNVYNIIYLNVYTRGQQAFPVKGQIANIFSFADHMVSS